VFDDGSAQAGGTKPASGQGVSSLARTASEWETQAKFWTKLVPSITMTAELVQEGARPSREQSSGCRNDQQSHGASKTR